MDNIMEMNFSLAEASLNFFPLEGLLTPCPPNSPADHPVFEMFFFLTKGLRIFSPRFSPALQIINGRPLKITYCPECVFCGRFD